MNASNSGAKPTREVVGILSTREAFESAVSDMIEAGIERSDLSVLSSHESLEAAGSPGKPWRDVLTAMVGELKYEGPLVASGLILLAGGAAAASVAAVIGAAVSGVAAKEVLDEVTATPHTEAFARSVEAGGIILWARTDTAAEERLVSEILETHGGQNVHTHERAASD